ncbi:MAG: signal peptidase II [Ureaplasma sp.]|nr:signal peptidase II [Ureaplasma sp.]MDE7221810.1 signal peptidase II [Ureaplasma sp.]
MNKKNHFFEKTFFQKKIVKIKNETLRDYFLKLFSYKLVFWKLIIILLVATIICVLSFSARAIVLNNFKNSIVYNPGVSFGFFAKLGPNSVLIIQIVTCAITFPLILVSTNIWFMIGFAGICFGGLCNVIDRSITIDPINNVHAVIDYIPFGKTVINIPDIFITSSAIVLGVGCLILIIKIIKSPDDTKQKEVVETSKKIENKSSN